MSKVEIGKSISLDDIPEVPVGKSISLDDIPEIKVGKSISLDDIPDNTQTPPNKGYVQPVQPPIPEWRQKQLNAMAAEKDAVKAFGRGVTSAGRNIGGVLDAVGLEAGGNKIKQVANKIDNRYLRLKKENSIVNKVAEGAGNMATFVIPGMGVSKGVSLIIAAPRIAAWLGIGASSVMESAINAGAVYNDATARGQSHDDAQKKAGEVFVSNLPLNLVFNRWMFNSLPSGKILKESLKAGGQEATKAGIQQVISNIVMHDPVMQGVKEQAAIGGVLGGGLQGARGILESQPKGVISNVKENQTGLPSNIGEWQTTQLTQPFQTKYQKVTTSETGGIKYPADNAAQSIIDFKAEAAQAKTLDESFAALSKIEKPLSKLQNTVIDPGFSDPEVSERVQSAEGLGTDSLGVKIKDKLGRFKEITRHFPKLEPKKDGELMFKLNVLENAGQINQTRAQYAIKGIINGLDESRYNIFKWNVIAPDIIREGTLPFGYDGGENGIETLKSDYLRFKEAADKDPIIKSALDAHKTFMQNLKQELVDNKLLPNGLSDDYFHRQVLEKMSKKAPYYNEEIDGSGKVGASSSKEVRNKKRGFQKRRTHNNLDFNTDYVESQYEYISQALTELQVKKTLDYVKGKYAIPPDDKLELEIPEGYTLWKPKKEVFQIANGRVDEALNNIINEPTYKGTDLEKRLNKIKEINKGYVFSDGIVIPKRIAHTLDNFKPPKSTNVVAEISREINTLWKKNALLNPMTFPRYQLNNWFGDMDIALGYTPKIFKYVPEAAKELWDFNITKKGMSPDIDEALKRSVINSGEFVNEIGSVKDTGPLKGLGKTKKSTWGKYFNGVKDFTNFRENVLRLASYKYFRDNYNKGSVLYGASPRKEIEQIQDIRDKSAKLATDLIGNYGNLSQGGMFIRQYLMPFYSWIEINSPRYFRLIANAPYEATGGAKPNTAKTVAKVGTAATLKTAVKAAPLAAGAMALAALKQPILTAGITAYNMAMFPQEYKEMRKTRSRFGIILGRNEQTGAIQYVPINSAYGDVLSWFGRENISADVHNLATGQQIEKVNPLIAAGSKAYNAVNPLLKTAPEALTGYTLYPDASRPRPIRDTGEYVTQSLLGRTAQTVYQHATGMPSPSKVDSAKKALYYEQNTKEAAYYRLQNDINDFLDEKSVERESTKPTKKMNALYYYKKAIRIGDKEAAEKYWNNYRAAGGSIKSLNASLKKSAPMSSFDRLRTVSKAEKRKLKQEFVKSYDQDIVKMADEYLKEDVQAIRKARKR